MVLQVPVEAIDGEVEFPVRIPIDVEIILVERPVAGCPRKLVPLEALRLFEPEALRIAGGMLVKRLEFFRADLRVEAVRYGMNHLAHAASPALAMSITKR